MNEYLNTAYTRNEAAAEALLFASGGVIRLDDICLVLKVKRQEASDVMRRLSERYSARKGGIILREVEDGWQLSSNPEYYDDLGAYFQESASGALSRAAMETLTIIAYNQPVTRAGIEMVRGVNSDGIIAKLAERGLIEERGRADSPGRPMLYGTTQLFMKSIGIKDLSELPDISQNGEITENITEFVEKSNLQNKAGLINGKTE